MKADRVAKRKLMAQPEISHALAEQLLRRRETRTNEHFAFAVPSPTTNSTSSPRVPRPLPLQPIDKAVAVQLRRNASANHTDSAEDGFHFSVWLESKTQTQTGDALFKVPSHFFARCFDSPGIINPSSHKKKRLSYQRSCMYVAPSCPVCAQGSTRRFPKTATTITRASSHINNRCMSPPTFLASQVGRSTVLQCFEVQG